MNLTQKKVPLGKGAAKRLEQYARNYMILDGFTVMELNDGRLDTVLCIPTSKVHILLDTYHSNLIGGHSGITKCYQTIFPNKAAHFLPNFKMFILGGGGYISQFSQILQLFKSFPMEVAQNDPQWPILPPRQLRLAQNGQVWSIFNFCHLLPQKVAQIDSEWPISPDLHLFQSFPTKVAHFSPNFKIIVLGGGTLANFPRFCNF